MRINPVGHIVKNSTPGHMSPESRVPGMGHWPDGPFCVEFKVCPVGDTRAGLDKFV
jgi:hypothetical protein